MNMRSNIFPTKNHGASMFSGKTPNRDTLRALASDCALQDNELDRDIGRLFDHMCKFISQTSSEHHEVHATYAENKIAEILNNPHHALANFEKKYANIDSRKKMEAVELCELAIKIQLDAMRRDDEIYKFYHKYDSLLKSRLLNANKKFSK